jgi:hypothetical protein
MQASDFSVDATEKLKKGFLHKCPGSNTTITHPGCVGVFRRIKKRKYENILMQLRNITLAIGVILIITGSMVNAAFAASPPTQEEPSNGAIDLPTTVTVRWNEFKFFSNPTYRVQVSRTSTFTDLFADIRISNGSIGYTVSGLAMDTVYYWRVNLSVDSRTSDWSPIWSFRTTNREIPPIPTLISPANGARDVPRSPTFVWSAVEGADSYDLKVGPFMIYEIQGTSITISEEYLSPAYSNYFFWVRSRNPAGVSDWSEMREFTRVSP